MIILKEMGADFKIFLLANETLIGLGVAKNDIVVQRGKYVLVQSAAG